MSTLVIAEHDNQENKPQTLVAIAAAEAIGNEIHVLVAGSGADSVAMVVIMGHALPGAALPAGCLYHSMKKLESCRYAR